MSNQNSNKEQVEDNAQVSSPVGYVDLGETFENPEVAKFASKKNREIHKIELQIASDYGFYDFAVVIACAFNIILMLGIVFGYHDFTHILFMVKQIAELIILIGLIYSKRNRIFEKFVKFYRWFKLILCMNMGAILICLLGLFYLMGLKEVSGPKDKVKKRQEEIQELLFYAMIKLSFGFYLFIQAGRIQTLLQEKRDKIQEVEKFRQQHENTEV